MSVKSELKDECRLCLAGIDDDDFTHIFPPAQTSSVPLITKIMVCVSLTVREEDALPKKICRSCERQLNIFYAFRQTCWEAFFTLMQNHSRSKRVDAIESQLACITGTEINNEKVSSKRNQVGSDLCDSSIPFHSNSSKRASENNAHNEKSVFHVQNRENDSENELERLLSSSERNDNKCDANRSQETCPVRTNSDKKSAQELSGGTEKHACAEISKNPTNIRTAEESLDESHLKENGKRKERTEPAVGNTDNKRSPVAEEYTKNKSQLLSTAQLLEKETDLAEVEVSECNAQQSEKCDRKYNKKQRNKGQYKATTGTHDSDSTIRTIDESAKKSDESELDLEKKIPQHHIVCVDVNDRYVGEVLTGHQKESKCNPKTSKVKLSRKPERGVNYHSKQRKQIMLCDVDSERNSEHSGDCTEATNDEVTVEEKMDQNLDEALSATVYLDDSMEENCFQVEEVLHGEYVEENVKYKCLRCDNMFNDLNTVTVHYIDCCQPGKHSEEADDNGSDVSPEYMENTEYLDGNSTSGSEKLNDDRESDEALESENSSKHPREHKDKFASSSRSLKLHRLGSSLKNWKVSSRASDVSLTMENTIFPGSNITVQADNDDASDALNKYDVPSNNSDVLSAHSDLESDVSNLNVDSSSRCDDADAENSLNNSTNKLNPVTLTTRVRTRKRKGRPSKTDHPCASCGSIFGSAALLKRHMVAHTGERPYACEICGKRFTQIGQLNFHRNFHENPRYRCEICGKPFLRPSDIEKHMRTHTGEKPFQCKVCSRSFAQLAALQQHERIHTGDKPYACEICGKSFSQKANKTKHVRIHKEGERPHACEICGRSFSELREMELHRAGHGGGKPRKCDHCDESFRKVSELNLHVRRFHTFERPHKCMFCPKAFYSVYNLKQHVMVHTGQRPFACPKCELRFTQKSNLTKHFERKHPEFALEKDGYIVVSEEAYDGEDMIIIERSMTEKVSYPLAVEREETVELGDDDIKRTGGNIEILAIAQ